MNSAGYLKWINSERKKVTFHCNKPYKSILIIRIELLHFDYPILYVTSTWGLIYYLFCNFWWYTVYTNTKKITYSGNVESSPLRILLSYILHKDICQNYTWTLKIGFPRSIFHSCDIFNSTCAYISLLIMILPVL